MAPLFQKIKVVGEREHQSRRSVERDVDEIVLASDGGGPQIDDVGDQEMAGERIQPDQFPDELVDVRRERLEESGPVLLGAGIAVVVEGEAVGDGGVADVEAGFSSIREEIELVVVRSGQLLVNGFEMDEGDGDAFGSEAEGKAHERVDVALVRHRDHDSVGLLLLPLVIRHFCVSSFKSLIMVDWCSVRICS